VLNEVAFACAHGSHIREQCPNRGELVIAGKNLNALLPAGLRVLLLDDLRVVFDEVGEARRGEDLFPKVVGLEALRIRRISGAVVSSPVEG
jgi:hypothetical protein